MSLRPWFLAVKEVVTSDAPVLAAGTALFALLATIPGMAAIVTVYGLVADPSDIAAHLDGLRQVFPGEVVDFLVTVMEREAGRSSKTLGLALATTLGLALYSARSAAGAMFAALNHVYRVEDERPTLRRLALTLAVAAATLVGLFVLSAVIVALPAVIALLRLPADVEAMTELLRWPLLLVLVMVGLVALYRAAPAPREHGHQHLWRGAIAATLLWLAASWLLSVWVDRVADYENVYGAFASVLVLILWFYASALCVLLGGMVNAQLERAAAERAAAAQASGGAPPP